MARFKADMVENYKPTSSGSFFSLANDGDYETVRLMYNDLNDVELFSVHEIDLGNGQTQWVNCLREYDEPIGNCPLCAAGNKLQVKMWVPLYMVNSQEVKIWERGRTFVAQIESAARRFKPLVSTIFDIERKGKKGDQTTTYSLINVDKDDTTLDQLPEVPQVVGGIVKEYTFEQLEDYLQTGKVPGNDTNNVQTRNPATDRRPASNTEQPVTRRPQPRTRTTNDSQPRTDVF